MTAPLTPEAAAKADAEDARRLRAAAHRKRGQRRCSARCCGASKVRPRRGGCRLRHGGGGCRGCRDGRPARHAARSHIARARQFRISSEGRRLVRAPGASIERDLVLRDVARLKGRQDGASLALGHQEVTPSLVFSMIALILSKAASSCVGSKTPLIGPSR